MACHFNLDYTIRYDLKSSYASSRSLRLNIFYRIGSWWKSFRVLIFRFKPEENFDWISHEGDAGHKEKYWGQSSSNNCCFSLLKINTHCYTRVAIYWFLYEILKRDVLRQSFNKLYFVDKQVELFQNHKFCIKIKRWQYLCYIVYNQFRPYDVVYKWRHANYANPLYIKSTTGGVNWAKEEDIYFFIVSLIWFTILFLENKLSCLLYIIHIFILLKQSNLVSFLFKDSMNFKQKETWKSRRSLVQLKCNNNSLRDWRKENLR